MTITPSHSAITATGLRKSFGDQLVLDGIDLAVPQGTVFALLGPNGAGKTTTIQILSTLIGADAGQAYVAGHDVARDPDAVRAVIGVTGQFSAVDNLLTGEENLHPDGRPAPPGPAGGPAAGRRAAGAVRPGRGGQQAGRDLLRRHEAPARPGHGPGRRPADHLPGRAHRRAGPAQPPHHVADHPRAGRRRGHDPADHPVPGGGGRARRPDRAARPRPAGRRGHRGRAQAPHPRRPHPPGVRLRRRARRGRPRPRGADPRRRGAHPADPQRRQRHVAAGPARPARRASIEVGGLSIHTPDLDDVFLTLTGQPDNEKEKEPVA